MLIMARKRPLPVKTGTPGGILSGSYDPWERLPVASTFTAALLGGYHGACFAMEIILHALPSTVHGPRPNLDTMVMPGPGPVG